MKRCSLAALLCASACAHAGQPGYSMPAVCDFISARYYEADGLVDGTPEKAALETTVRDADIYRLQRNGQTVEFFVVDGGRRLVSVRLSDQAVPAESKRALLRRLGANPARVGNRFEAGCDMNSMALQFKQGKLAEVQVWGQID